MLIGDAAHAGAPTMAQLGIMGMEDAYVLAEVLRSAETVACALDSYETRRKPRATWVQQQSRAIQESIHNSPAFHKHGHQFMRDSFARLIPQPSSASSEASSTYHDWHQQGCVTTITLP